MKKIAIISHARSCSTFLAKTIGNASGRHIEPTTQYELINNRDRNITRQMFGMKPLKQSRSQCDDLEYIQRYYDEHPTGVIKLVANCHNHNVFEYLLLRKDVQIITLTRLYHSDALASMVAALIAEEINPDSKMPFAEPSSKLNQRYSDFYDKMKWFSFRSGEDRSIILNNLYTMSLVDGTRKIDYVGSRKGVINITTEELHSKYNNPHLNEIVGSELDFSEFKTPSRRNEIFKEDWKDYLADYRKITPYRSSMYGQLI